MSSRSRAARSSSASPAGDGDGDRLMERVEPFGQDMARPHQVALAASTARLDDATAAISSLEHDIVHRVGDRDILASTKDALIVVLAPAYQLARTTRHGTLLAKGEPLTDDEVDEEPGRPGAGRGRR